MRWIKRLLFIGLGLVLAIALVLIATITLLSFMPARCWMAPEIPTAT